MDIPGWASSSSGLELLKAERKGRYEALGGDENLTDTVVAITVEIEAITAVTFEHKVVEIEAVLFTRVPIFTQT